MDSRSSFSIEEIRDFVHSTSDFKIGGIISCGYRTENSFLSLPQVTKSVPQYLHCNSYNFLFIFPD